MDKRVFPVSLLIAGALALTMPVVAAALPSIVDAAPQLPAAASLEAYRRQGTAQIRGRLWANTRLFGRVAYAKTHVLLIPYTDYGVWYIRSLAQDLEKISKTTPPYADALTAYTHVTTTDASGDFVFSNLPSGDYLINATVSKEEASRPLVRRDRLGTDINGDPITVPVDVPGLKIRAEANLLAASIHLPSGRAEVIDEFKIVGSHLCCDAGIER